jgi:DNA invertase Pin-like site-specific DNA recombinase
LTDPAHILVELERVADRLEAAIDECQQQLLRQSEAQALVADTNTPTGKMMFQMLGVFSEFERAMIVDRVKAGMRRAKAQG